MPKNIIIFEYVYLEDLEIALKSKYASIISFNDVKSNIKKFE